MLASLTCSSVTAVSLPDEAFCCALSDIAELKASVARQKAKTRILFKMDSPYKIKSLAEEILRGHW
jgi:hypothetical protein